ncbi:hypothetical protein DMUE_4310 [Dictyocoela muelleri]|nr:hypothetical protein EQH57_0177 [Dictyocoela roeselum]KAG0436266.1 hypothetical protein DMUE_4310 [Dictyocoela muelleri]
MRCSGNVDDSSISVLVYRELLADDHCFEYLCYHVKKTEPVQTEVKWRVKGGREMLGVLKNVLSCMTFAKEAMRGLYEGVFSQLCCMELGLRIRVEERTRLNISEMKCLRGMTGVTLRDWTNNDIVRIRAGMVKKLEDGVDSHFLRLFGQMMREDDGRLVRGW